MAKKKTVSDEVNHNLNNYFKPEVGTDGLSLELSLIHISEPTRPKR